MKKVILSFVLVLGSLSLVSAQQNAIGLKLGWGADLSYQRYLNDANRLEFNLGLNSFESNSPFTLSGAYQWVWDLSQLAPGFQWYAGVGAMCGIWSQEKVTVAGQTIVEGKTHFYVWAIGNVGIEYNFDFPLQLALDWTPALRITPDFGGFGADGVKFAARWRF
jgi:hypothetical protein